MKRRLRAEIADGAFAVLQRACAREKRWRRGKEIEKQGGLVRALSTPTRGAEGKEEGEERGSGGCGFGGFSRERENQGRAVGGRRC